jgi:DNA-binding MarR family transcriptional regulator
MYTFKMSTDADYEALLTTLHRVDLLSRRVADQQLIRRIGVGRAVFLILDLLNDADSSGISQREIADRIGSTKAAVSRHVATAQERGWLDAKPSATSRRENTITLTPAGRKLVERGRRHRSDAAREATVALGRREMETATQTLARLAEFLEQRLRS